MSHCLSNLSISHPMTTQKPFYMPNSTSSFPKFSKCFSIKAMAGESMDSIDHLQRLNKQQKTTQQAQRRSGPVAPIGLWDRFPTARTVQQMIDTMDKIIEDPLSYTSNGYSSDRGGYSRGRTPWEIKEAETEYKMRFDMPGMTKEDVKVWVEEKMLVLKAEKSNKKKGESEEEENSGEWSAKSYGRYSCRIALPENVQFEKIKAEVKDGVLYICLPKSSVSGKILDISVQ